MVRIILACVLSIALTACAGSIDGAQYADAGEDFDLYEFFDGRVTAWGIVQGRDGNLLQRFVATIDGSVEGDTLTLDESFSYSIGEGVTERVWTIERADGVRFTGSATDIETAAGQDFGNAFFWGYQMDLPVDDNTYRVKFQDWIWAFDKKRIVNRSYIKKFGITFAEVTIFMEKQ